MAARSPPSRWTGLNSGEPDASQSSKAVAPGGISSPHSTTSCRSPLPRRSSSGSPLSAAATTARVPESSTTNRTSSGVSMTLIGMTAAPVLAMA